MDVMLGEQSTCNLRWNGKLGPEQEEDFGVNAAPN